MILSAPLIISARLLPAVKIGDCTISVAHRGYDCEGRLQFGFYYDRPGRKTYVDNSQRSGVGSRPNGKTIRQAMEAQLSFLLHAVEARESRERRGGKYDPADRDSGENLFPRFIVRWADANESEIEMAQFDLSEGE